MTVSSAHSSRRALLLIDFQKDFLTEGGRMPVERNQAGPVLAAAQAAIDRARSAGDLIIAIGNEFRPGDHLMNLLRRGAAIAGTPGARWDDRLSIDGAVYLPKWSGDAFVNPALDRLLKERRIEELVLTGLMARACVTATARTALARGYRVSALAPAIACYTDASRAAALRRLEQRGVRLAA